MSDWFLRDHVVADLIVDIGGRTHPISIRDQMTRGRVAVDRMATKSWVGPGRDLLVGGDPRGLARALRVVARARSAIVRSPERLPLPLARPHSVRLARVALGPGCAAAGVPGPADAGAVAAPAGILRRLGGSLSAGLVD
jgi:hypothetical protein